MRRCDVLTSLLAIPVLALVACSVPGGPEQQGSESGQPSTVTVTTTLPPSSVPSGDNGPASQLPDPVEEAPSVDTTSEPPRPLPIMDGHCTSDSLMPTPADPSRNENWFIEPPVLDQKWVDQRWTTKNVDLYVTPQGTAILIYSTITSGLISAVKFNVTCVTGTREEGEFTLQVTDILYRYAETFSDLTKGTKITFYVHDGIAEPDKHFWWPMCDWPAYVADREGLAPSRWSYICNGELPPGETTPYTR